MLKYIELENYRCFSKSKIILKEMVVIVGSNNAGKSTIIEALRIISNAVQRYQYAVYKDVPISLRYKGNNKGIRIDCTKLKIDLESIVNFYQNDIATIKASFENKNQIIVNLNTEGAYAFIANDQGIIAKNRSDAREILLEKISIMPQLSLIREAEKKYSKDIVESNMETYLSSKHFRNELLSYKSDKFEKFRRLAEETWDGLKIKNLNYNPFEENSCITLFIEDNKFLAEIGLMGSGIQMWLQVIWFIVKSENASIIILDEPDVYMHPDLQRKLIKIVKNRYRQVVTATHSLEIISQVEPNNIVSIDKKSKKMKYAGELCAVQEMVDNLGSAQNLSLIRLGTMKKCIFVEGKDMKYLNKFYEILFPKSTFSLETLPCIPLGGWTRFNEALGASRLFHEETQGGISAICLLDRDYHSEEEIKKIQEKSIENHLKLIVWKKKEIENYFIIPRVIYRLVDDIYLDFEEFEGEINCIINEMKEEIIDNFSSQIHIESNRRLEIAACNREARSFVNLNWNTLESKLSIANGKNALSMVNGWLQSKHKRSCSMSKLISLMTPEDISDEIKETIDILICNISNIKSN